VPGPPAEVMALNSVETAFAYYCPHLILEFDFLDTLVSDDSIPHPEANLKGLTRLPANMTSDSLSFLRVIGFDSPVRISNFRPFVEFVRDFLSSP
jgi:hypothetical protein